MGIFQKIRDAILPTKAEAKTPEPRPQTRDIGTTGGFGADVPPRADPISEVDVEKRLASMPGSEDLNWRTSIVDLLKLVGVDSSYENRKELAHELGNTDYAGSAEDNIALHKQTMRELAKNGGRVPADMLD